MWYYSIIIQKGPTPGVFFAITFLTKKSVLFGGIYKIIGV